MWIVSPGGTGSPERDQGKVEDTGQFSLIYPAPACPLGQSPCSSSRENLKHHKKSALKFH